MCIIHIFKISSPTCRYYKNAELKSQSFILKPLSVELISSLTLMLAVIFSAIMSVSKGVYGNVGDEVTLSCSGSGAPTFRWIRG